jgi:tetratricopeptide (TPR) repeat protein
VSSCRIVSCTLVFYILLFAIPVWTHAQTAPAAAPGDGAPATSDADALYRERADLARARQAAAIWEARLAAEPTHFESAWKLSRTLYWLGGHDVEKARRPALERGVAAGKQAAALQPSRPEGHFWTAANMGALAESFGLRQGLRYRGAIKESLEMVLKLDPAFQEGSADRALGRWYFKVPGLFGGSNKKSEEHLRKSLTYFPDSTVSRFFLAETLFDLDRDTEAIAELEKVIAAPSHPDWVPEDREYKEKALTRLKSVRRN